MCENKCTVPVNGLLYHQKYIELHSSGTCCKYSRKTTARAMVSQTFSMRPLVIVCVFLVGSWHGSVRLCRAAARHSYSCASISLLVRDHLDWARERSKGHYVVPERWFQPPSSFQFTAALELFSQRFCLMNSPKLSADLRTRVCDIAVCQQRNAIRSKRRSRSHLFHWLVYKCCNILRSGCQSINRLMFQPRMTWCVLCWYVTLDLTL